MDVQQFADVPACGQLRASVLTQVVLVHAHRASTRLVVELPRCPHGSSLLDRSEPLVHPGRFSSALRDTIDRLLEVAERLVETARSGDLEVALADAAVYLEAFGHLGVAWIWLEQWLIAQGKDGAFYAGKRAAAQYFLTRELPKVEPMLVLLASGDRLTLDLDPRVL
jgi:hypothetical protein